LKSNNFATCLQAARRGDELALATLYDKFASKVHTYLYYRTGNLNEADDLTEDVFLRVLEAIGSCRAQNERAFAAWLFRIAHNKLVNWYKQRARRPEVALTEGLPDPTDGPGLEAERRISYQRLKAALADLTDEQREVIVLRFIGGMRIAEVAQVIGNTQGAVKALQHRALANLRRILKEEGG
jgi:RNA polymerase sigma-70 factor (ECF subfamily)